MRLSAVDVAAIKAAAAEAFGPDAVVRLFGSRVDDDLRGGDIDLHVEADAVDVEWRRRGVFEDRLFRAIDPQKVDLVLSRRGVTPHAFEAVAYRQGVIL